MSSHQPSPSRVTPHKDPPPVMTIPVIAPPQTVNRANAFANVEGASNRTVSSPQSPFVATPSVPSEVIERPADKTGPVAPPVINPRPIHGINPRFHRPGT